jgi:catechol 2,3-dioxygenase-like lactoylglutathione lyase family enzyme
VAHLTSAPMSPRIPGPLDHLTLTTVDLAAGAAFYDAVLGALGLVRLDELVDEEEDEPQLEAVGWGPADSRSVLWLVRGAVPTTGLHVRLRAGGRTEVEAFHRAGLAAGGTGFAAPRRWAVYRRGDFNAIVRDPTGNLVEAVSAE